MEGRLKLTEFIEFSDFFRNISVTFYEDAIGMARPQQDCRQDCRAAASLVLLGSLVGFCRETVFATL